MEPRDFVYWLKGYLEISGTTSIDTVGLDIIKSHLDLVLTKKTRTDSANEFVHMPGVAYCATTSDVSKRIRQ